MERRQEARKNGGECHYIAYTPEEIRAAWHTDGQGHTQAVARGDACVIVPCIVEAIALEISAMFVRKVFAIPTCTHWDGKTVSLYCGDAGSGWQGTMRSAEKMLLEYGYEYPKAVPNDLWAGR